MSDSTSALRRTALGLAAPLVQDRPVFLLGAAAQGDQMARFFRQAGAQEVQVIRLNAPADTTDRRFAAYERQLLTPSADLSWHLAVADPEGTAVIYAGSFTKVREVCGRRVLGYRRAEHFAAERKDQQPRFTGVKRAVLDIGTHGEAAAELLSRSRCEAVVVQGIPRGQLAMSASHTYVLPEGTRPDRISSTLRILSQDCGAALVRVLDRGLPVTFYGFVTRSWVVDFGPFEALVYCDLESGRLKVPGILRPATLDGRVLGEARTTVHAVARRLSSLAGYAGAFGIDGVVSDRGYLIHEINPRMCSGFALLDRMQHDPIPFSALDLLLREQGKLATDCLAHPLQKLAAEIGEDQTPRFCLWDSDGLRRQRPADIGDQTPPEVIRRRLEIGTLVHVSRL